MEAGSILLPAFLDAAVSCMRRRSGRCQETPLMAGFCSMRQTPWGRRKAVLGQMDEEAQPRAVRPSPRASSSMRKEGDRAIHIGRQAENGAAAREAIIHETELLSKRSTPRRMHIVLREPLRAGGSYATSNHPEACGKERLQADMALVTERQAANKERPEPKLRALCHPVCAR